MNRFGLDWVTVNRLGRVSLLDETSNFETGRYVTLDKLKSAVCEYVSSPRKISLFDVEDLPRGALDGVSNQF